jgi:hypothetical protein
VFILEAGAFHGQELGAKAHVQDKGMVGRFEPGQVGFYVLELEAEGPFRPGEEMKNDRFNVMADSFFNYLAG